MPKLKTTAMEINIGRRNIKNTSVDRRLCSTCENYKGKLKCKVLGKIKNPNEIDCSWWKEKINENKIKN